MATQAEMAAANGGWIPYQLVAAASTNATNVKATAGVVGYIVANNVNAAVRYLKLYNKATAPTIGTDTPVMTIALPAGTVTVVPVPVGGIVFNTGIGFGTTTEATVAGTTGISASETVVNIGYR